MTKEEEKKSVAEAVWLNYFNGVLHKDGLINDKEWAQMSRKISAHSRAPVKRKRRDDHDER